MLHLLIRNFLLIDEHNFCIDGGFSAITGETGAGKSTILRAIRHLCGERAKNEVIKAGKDFAEIVGTIDISHFPHVHEYLSKMAIVVEEDMLIMRRVIRRNSKSSSFINGSPATQQQLKDLGMLLFSILGQHDAHTLAKPEQQLKMVDSYGVSTVLLDECRKAYSNYNIKKKALADITSKREELEGRRQLLSYQLEEVAELSPQQSEFEEIEKEHAFQTKAGDLWNGLQGIIHDFDKDDGVLRSIRSAVRVLEDFSQMEKVKPLFDMFCEAETVLGETLADAQSLESSLDVDPAQIQALDERMTAYMTLSKKLFCEPAHLHQKQKELEQELQELSVLTIEEAEKELHDAYVLFKDVADQLHEERAVVSATLAIEVNKHLEGLNMRKGCFSIAVNEKGMPSATGLTDTVFKLKANAEIPAEPLMTAASGGELSRVTLALNAVLGSNESTKRFRFLDEVDTGVSGATAEVMGQLLLDLSKDAPVVAVTHITKVACMADHQFHVKKSDSENSTNVIMTKLNYDERLNLAAELMFGENYTESGRQEAATLFLANAYQ